MYICDWIWQNPASMHRAMLGDTAISSINCIIASWWIMLKEWKLQQVVVHSLAMIVWVNNFQTAKIQVILSSCFMTVMILQVVVIGVVGGWVEGGLLIGVQNGIQESQRFSLGPYWTFFVLTALQIEDNRHWLALHGLSSPPSTNTREPWPSNDAKVPLEAYTGSKKSCHRN